MYLSEELGLEPTEELRQLERQILDQDEALDVTSRHAIKRRSILVADAGELTTLSLLDSGRCAGQVR